MAQINDILDSLCTVEGVQGAFLVDSNGGLVAGVTRTPQDENFIAQLAHTSVKSGERIADAMGRKMVTQSYVEYADASLTLDILSNGAVLALLASSGANLGRIRLELRKNKKSVEAIMG